MGGIKLSCLGEKIRLVCKLVLILEIIMLLNNIWWRWGGGSTMVLSTGEEKFGNH